MKSLKLSFALVIAILAIGVTIATKANPFDKKVLHRCFINITLIDGAGSSVLLNATTNPPSCAFAKSQIAAGIKYVNDVTVPPSIIDREECDEVPQSFCCVVLTEGIASDPGTFLPLDGPTPKKWHVAIQTDVVCRTTPN